MTFLWILTILVALVWVVAFRDTLFLPQEAPKLFQAPISKPVQECRAQACLKCMSGSSWTCANCHQNYFLDKGTCVPIPENNYSPKPQATRLFQALIEQDWPTAVEAIELGADLEVRDNVYGVTPLFFAAMFDNEETVNLMIERKAKTDLTDKNGVHLITWAGYSKNANIIETVVG